MVKLLSGCLLAICLMMVGLLMGGCGRSNTPAAKEVKEPAVVASSQAKVFESADAQTKAVWDQTVTAAGTKDYVAAITALDKLRKRKDLTQEQRAAVNEMMSAEYKQMYAGANGGDANAVNAIKKLNGEK